MPYLVLENTDVLDVENGSVATGNHIIIENDVIVEIGSGRPPGKGADKIDLAGRTVLPGLIDCHVHVTAFAPTFLELAQSSPAYVAYQTAIILKDMLHRGFTTVRDVGGADYGIARAVSEGLIEGPRVFFGGKALSQTGGHGDMRTSGMNAYDDAYAQPGLGVLVNGVAEVRRAAREEIRRGANHIKFMGGGGASSPTDRLDSDQFSEEEIQAIVEEANMANIYTVVHAYTTRQIERSARLGVRSIEHCNFIDDATAALIRERNAFMTPTLVAYYSASKHGIEAGMSQGTVDKINMLVGPGLASLEIARRAGVPMAYGTDLVGNFMHKYQLQEFAIRNEVMSPIELIRSATIVGARLLQQEKTLGQVKPGYKADLIAYDRNPLEHFDVLQAPERELALIIKNGDLVKAPR